MPSTTSKVPIHFPKIKPPIRAIGEPKPKNGNTHKIIKIKKIIDVKNKFEFLSFRKYNLFSLIKSYEVISWMLNFEKNNTTNMVNKIRYDKPIIILIFLGFSIMVNRIYKSSICYLYI